MRTLQRFLRSDHFAPAVCFTLGFAGLLALGADPTLAVTCWAVVVAVTW